MYREYTLTVRPSRDFLQELLWHGRNIIVLKPESLRQEMIDILKDMTKSYETGECLNGEEQENPQIGNTQCAQSEDLSYMMIS